LIANYIELIILKKGVYNERLLTIRYKQSTKQALFFFDAKKEPKKLLGGKFKSPNAL